MVELTIPSDEANAIDSIDTVELDRLIDQAIRTESTTALYQLYLERCGPYISRALRQFERAVAAHNKAKSARKREQTGRDLWREGYGLSHAVGAMKSRLEEEREDAKLFVINDRILPPVYFTENLSVTIHYQWRETVEDEWKHGSIRFTHTVELHRDHFASKPKRKPSRATLERERENELSHVWEHLASGALYTLRDYFRDGRDGKEIPELFEAVVDPHSRSLSNYSTDFWRKRPE